MQRLFPSRPRRESAGGGVRLGDDSFVPTAATLKAETARMGQKNRPLFHAWSDGAESGQTGGEIIDSFVLNTLSQLSLSARGDAELGAVTPGDSQAASSTLPTERAQPTLRSESGAADTNTASADMHGAGAASVQSTVSYPADKAEYQRLVSAGVRNLPNTAAEYARFKHVNPEGWYELIRRESRYRPEIVTALDLVMMPENDSYSLLSSQESIDMSEAENYNGHELQSTDNRNASSGNDNQFFRRTTIDYYTNDPVRIISGSIKDSHSNAMNFMIEIAEMMGVEVILSDERNIYYSPGITVGQPGQLHFNPNNSYAAWIHEFNHMLDDFLDNWPSFRARKDNNRSRQMEIEAYGLEIQYAEMFGRTDVADRLRLLRDNELKKINGG